MRLGWIGFHVEGLAALRALLEQGVRLEGVITLRSDRAAARSGAGDYRSLLEPWDVPLYEVANINDDHARSLLETFSLDVAFVIGWTQIVRPEVLRLARVGMIGAHASLLPKHRGRAPINWVLIKGEKQTGNTLMWLAEGVDSGDIIDQVAIPVTPYDTCASLYEKVAETNRDMILRLVPRLFAGERPGRPQPPADAPCLPGRRPEDGRIDWSRSNVEIYDFIRALTRPYPGAFSDLDGSRWRIWNCALLPEGDSRKSVIDNDGFSIRPTMERDDLQSVVPGQISGPVFSPVDDACGQVVACGKGALLLLEMERDDGRLLKGRLLSEQPWIGKVWRYEKKRAGDCGASG